jgi:hypothetical protein
MLSDRTLLKNGSEKELKCKYMLTDVQNTWNRKMNIII